MQVRRTSKQPKDGEKGATKQLGEEEINKAKQQKEEEKRRAKRLKEENEITTTILSGVKNFPKEKIIYEYSKDISVSGAKIQGNILLPVDTILQIDLTLKSAKQKVTAFGKVKWNKIVIDGVSYEAGVEFVDTPIDVINKLEQYISSKEKYLNLNPVGVPYWIFAKFNRDKIK